MRKYLKLRLMVAILAVSCIISACGKKEENKDEVTVGNVNATVDITEAPKITEDSKLYDDFIRGEAKVKYMGDNGIRSFYVNFTELCMVNQSYSIDQIKELIEKSRNKVSAEIVYERIDCGSDGVAELLVTIPLVTTDLYMIMKDVNGELVLCYTGDYIDNVTLTINHDGTICKSVDDEGIIDITEYSLVDADGNYKFYYGLKKTTTYYTDYTVYRGTAKTVVPPDGIDSEHVAINDYYFENDLHYISYSILDDDHNDITTDADFEDSNEVKKHFAQYGVTTYSPKEIEDILNNRATEIGKK